MAEGLQMTIMYQVDPGSATVYPSWPDLSTWPAITMGFLSAFGDALDALGVQPIVGEPEQAYIDVLTMENSEGQDSPVIRVVITFSNTHLIIPFEEALDVLASAADYWSPVGPVDVKGALSDFVGVGGTLHTFAPSVLLETWGDDFDPTA